MSLRPPSGGRSSMPGVEGAVSPRHSYLGKRRYFLICWALAVAFQLAATFASGRAAIVFGMLAIVFVSVGFLFVVAWMLERSGR
jgi:hypothetical protein